MVFPDAIPTGHTAAPIPEALAPRDTRVPGVPVARGGPAPAGGVSGVDSELGAPRAEWGLRRYVAQVAQGLGVGLASTCCEVGATPTAYVALQARLPSAPGLDTALCWDPTQGWSLGVEPGSSGEVQPVAYLGGVEVLPEPETVLVFAKTVLAGHVAGQPAPPALICDGLGARLAEYAHPAICHEQATAPTTT